MAMADSHGLPVAIAIASGPDHEVTLVEQTLEGRFTEDLPSRVVGDKAYDSTGLDQTLAEKGIRLVAPERLRSSDKPTKGRTQDGRELRRYKRRWKVERLFAWLFASRRLVTRYELKAANFLGFLHIACIRILMRYF